MLAVVAGVIAAWHAIPAPPRAAPLVTRVVEAPAAVIPAEPQTVAAAAQPAPAATDTPERNQTEEQAQPVASVADVPAPVRFYRFDEVDRPAMPDSDWNLDTQFLDAAGVSRLVFEVFVSATGEIVECTIVEPETLDDDVRQRLVDRLRQSTIEPAMRAGLPVASVRKIEVTTTPVE